MQFYSRYGKRGIIEFSRGFIANGGFIEFNVDVDG